MPLIYVRTLPGRVAYDAHRGGNLIPADRFVPVPATPYIDRLLRVHGDIEERPAKAPAPVEAMPESADGAVERKRG